MKKFILGGVATLALVCAGTGAASAGEYTGNGGATPAGERAGSICAYSGQDVPDDIENNPSPELDDDWLGRGVQNYGQYVSLGFKDVLGEERPGNACRGYASMR